MKKRVQQVHGRVFDTARVLVDRQPVIAFSFSHGMSSVFSGSPDFQYGEM